jgi:DNA-binding LacI/PurR family transcriptional regulator
VAKIAAKLNYVPRRVGSKPQKRDKITRIGVCVGNPCLSADGHRDTSYVGLHHLISLERTASAEKIGVLVGFVDAMDPANRIDNIPVLQRNETGGVILVYPFPEPLVAQLSRQMPVVSIEHVYPSASLDTIGPAHSVDVMSAVAYLHELGHRRIAYVCDEDAKGHKLTLGLRHAGYVSGLTRCGMSYRPEDVANIVPPIIPKSQITQWVMSRIKDGVTAVITSIDRHGYLLWDELTASGIKVPQDVSLVGIGGVCRDHGLPQLTTWRCDYDAIAATAIEALRSRSASKRTRDLYQEIASVFVAGSSSGPVPSTV